MTVPTEIERALALVTAVMVEHDDEVEGQAVLAAMLIKNDPNLPALTAVLAGLCTKLVSELAAQMEMDAEDYWRGVCERTYEP